jgi:hypothetical protein
LIRRQNAELFDDKRRHRAQFRKTRASSGRSVIGRMFTLKYVFDTLSSPKGMTRRPCRREKSEFSNHSPLAALFVFSRCGRTPSPRPQPTVHAPDAFTGARGFDRTAETRQGQRYMVNRMTLVTSLLRRAALTAFGCAALNAFVSQATANDRAIRVDIDYARIVKIPQGAQTLVIGNPLIADVTMLKNSQLMVITGKSFGTTNLIVLDRTGAQVGESIVTVVPAEDKLVVQRGVHRESLACNPKCARAVDLADDIQYMNTSIEAVKAHDSAATSTRR